VLDRSGSLDVSQEILEKAEIVVGSFHGFPYGSKQEFLKALHGMLSHPRLDIWGHPVTFLRNVGLTHSEQKQIINQCIEKGVLIEDSLAQAYPTPPDFLELARDLGAQIVRNSDAHSREDLKRV
jgi:histidinol phosphatase-like PHP family hydrolase